MRSPIRYTYRYAIPARVSTPGDAESVRSLLHDQTAQHGHGSHHRSFNHRESWRADLGYAESRAWRYAGVCSASRTEYRGDQLNRTPGKLTRSSRASTAQNP